MRGARVRAGDVVRSGPSGAPPAGLRAFEVVDVAPDTSGLVRPAGSTVTLRNGTGAWVSAYPGAGYWVRWSNLRPASRMIVQLGAGHDPTVIGVAAPVGAIAFDEAGQKAWLHYAAGATAWRPLSETRATATLSAGPVSTWDVPVIAAASEAICLRARIPVAGTAAYVYARANNAYVTGGNLRGFINGTGSAFGGQPTWGYTSLTEEVVAGVLLKPAVNGKRRVEFWSTTGLVGYVLNGEGLVSLGDVSTIGFGIAGLNLPVGTELSFRVTGYWGCEP